MTRRPIALDLAEEAGVLRSAALPPAVLARACDLLLDFLGVALGGAGEPSSVTLRRGLYRLGPAGDSVVLGVAERLSAPHAALANGAAAHALEMDDTHPGGSIHLGASVFPAPLAAAQPGGAGGGCARRSPATRSRPVWRWRSGPRSTMPAASIPRAPAGRSARPRLPAC